jgi:hypothetical protein
MEKIIGFISAIIVFASVIPYAIRVWQRKITPNLISWTIWTLLGVAILISYRSSGAKESVYPAIIGCINPLIIMVLILTRNLKKSKKKLSFWDFMCGIFGVISIVLWYTTNNDPHKVQYALYIAIIADFWALVPTIKDAIKTPSEDRPFMWLLYSVGYSVSIFAITEHTVANYILPVYMFCGPIIVFILLARYRIKNKIPFKEWV